MQIAHTLLNLANCGSNTRGRTLQICEVYFCKNIVPYEVRRVAPNVAVDGAGVDCNRSQTVGSIPEIEPLGEERHREF